MTAVARLAMWSGPRNLSTALMRSFEARGDCSVTDEPLYAHYLARTGLDHPGAAEILASCERDAEVVVAELLGPPPSERPLWYVKHMAHHLLPGMDRSWIARCRNALLVREPEPMIASLARALGRAPRIEETGLPQQVELVDSLHAASLAAPHVLSAERVAADPEAELSALCDALAIPFTRKMLSWEPGPRATDGIWAPHWYASVETSTGFVARPRSEVSLPAELLPLARLARPLYERLLQG